MIWPIATLLLAGALVALHLWWRSRYAAARHQSLRDVAQCQESAREQHREILARQTAIFDNMPQGLLLLNSEARVQLANRAWVALFQLPEEVQGRTLLETLRLHELSEAVESLSPERPASSFELKLSHPQEMWLQVNAAAVFSPQGQRQTTVLVFHDLTRLKQLERTRQEFVANVSHELRTPLSLIKGYAETLLTGAKEDPALATRFLQTIDRNAERLARLVEDLLTVSELESGRLQLNLRPMELDKAVDKVLKDFRDKAAARAVTFSQDLTGLLVRADPDRLDQVLCNLVDNAIKYGRQGGQVSVEARAIATDGVVEVAVRDDGPGLAPEALERVFERFFRVDKARSRDRGGTGLGLAIVKHIIQSHGGKVWAQSQRGAGTTFFFTVPQPANAAERAGLPSPA